MTLDGEAEIGVSVAPVMGNNDSNVTPFHSTRLYMKDYIAVNAFLRAVEKAEECDGGDE
jgi:hypothetical protein